MACRFGASHVQKLKARRRYLWAEIRLQDFLETLGRVYVHCERHKALRVLCILIQQLKRAHGFCIKSNITKKCQFAALAGLITLIRPQTVPRGAAKLQLKADVKMRASGTGPRAMKASNRHTGKAAACCMVLSQHCSRNAPNALLAQARFQRTRLKDASDSSSTWVVHDISAALAPCTRSQLAIDSRCGAKACVHRPRMLRAVRDARRPVAHCASFCAGQHGSTPALRKSTSQVAP